MTRASSGFPAIDAMTGAQADQIRAVWELGNLNWRELSAWCSTCWGPGWGEGNQIAGMEICERLGLVP